MPKKIRRFSLGMKLDLVTLLGAVSSIIGGVSVSEARVFRPDFSVGGARNLASGWGRDSSFDKELNYDYEPVKSGEVTLGVDFPIDGVDEKVQSSAFKKPKGTSVPPKEIKIVPGDIYDEQGGLRRTPIENNANLVVRYDIEDFPGIPPIYNPDYEFSVIPGPNKGQSILQAESREGGKSNMVIWETMKDGKLDHPPKYILEDVVEFQEQRSKSLELSERRAGFYNSKVVDPTKYVDPFSNPAVVYKLEPLDISEGDFVVADLSPLLVSGNRDVRLSFDENIHGMTPPIFFSYMDDYGLMSGVEATSEGNQVVFTRPGYDDNVRVSFVSQGRDVGHLTLGPEPIDYYAYYHNEFTREEYQEQERDRAPGVSPNSGSIVITRDVQEDRYC